MKSFLVKATAVTLSLFATGFVAHAHHSIYGNFDIKRLVEVKGKFTGADIINPHAWFHFEQVDEKGALKLGADGQPIVWSFETPGPAVLRRMGITQSLFTKGDVYTVYAPPAMDGSTKGLFLLTVFPDGRRLLIGNPSDPVFKPVAHLLEELQKK